MSTNRRNWTEAPMVFITRPVCPTCGHDRYNRIRTNANGDGTATKLCECRGCGEAYKIVEEFPETGLSNVCPS